VIITTRSKRPEWVRRFFGSPVDDLIRKAGCPVVTV
jgi:nucleotide-binding universal stress UspA family protein